MLHKTPLYYPIFLQSFRIGVELLIYFTFLEGVFPKRVTFEGLNFDIVVGLSAIGIGWAVYKGKIGRKGVLVWNIVSLCVLALTVFSFNWSYYFNRNELSEAAMKFIEFPYLLLAACLLPIAIFLHVFSIRQLQVRQP